MIGIVCGAKDIASMNMFEKFLDRGFKITDRIWEGMPVYQRNDILLVKTNSELVYADNLEDLDVSEIVFASRHRSEAGEPALSTHSIGNFGSADLGGRPGVLGFCLPNLERSIYLELRKCTLDYDVTLEATHHGPRLTKPCVFVELGSSEKYWKDEEAASFVVSCIIRGLEKEDRAETVVGVGGGHYCEKFSELESEKYAFGHILPKYAQDFLSKEMVRQMLERTPRASKVIMEKKGVKAQSEVREKLGEFDIELV